ncbi:MAG: DUF4349 domain-containing protein [Bacillota bacterium]|nr:DUF4349 domain-containing protein [Bacillota bacterium]
MKRYFKKLLIPFICLFILGAFTGCKKSDKSTAQSSNSAVMPAPGESSKGGGLEESKNDVASGTDNVQQAVTERKVIKNSKIQMETKHFDDAVNFVITRTEKEKGYIQSSNIQGGRLEDGQYAGNRYAEFTVRIPVDKLNSFLKDAEALGVVVSRSDNDEDVTSQYFDTEARVKTLKVEEERLLAILQKSDKLTDIIELEKRLSELRNEIESLTGTLKKYDSLVALATVSLTIREVQTESQIKAKPVTFGEKLAEGFKQSVSALYEILKGIVLIIVYVLPFAAAAAVLFIPIRMLVKWYNKRRKAIEEKGTGSEDKK